jgi:hypothetical protein
MVTKRAKIHIPLEKINLKLKTVFKKGAEDRKGKLNYDKGINSSREQCKIHIHSILKHLNIHRKYYI